MDDHPLQPIFVTHTSGDDPFVRELRIRLEHRGYAVLEDSAFQPGSELPVTVKESIERAGHVVAVCSAQAVRSEWVRRELRYAHKVAKDRPGFRIIPLLLAGASPSDLRAIFELPEPAPNADLEELPGELISIHVGKGPGAMDKLVAWLFDTLEGKPVPEHSPADAPQLVTGLADLVLRLRNPRFELVKNEQGAEVRRPVAEATLAFYPPNATQPDAQSPEFTLAAPLGKIEAGDLSFYLERYFITPFGPFKEQAERIEQRLPVWGEALWDALAPDRAEHRAVLNAWKHTAATAERRFTIEAPPPARLPHAADERQKQAHAASLEATTELLALPWELLHDRVGYVFHDGLGVRVRRSLPGGDEPAELPPEMRKLPLRVLIVCARPEDDGVDYINHRVSVRPVTEALNALGELATYDILTPPTFPGLREKLRDALARGQPYHIVHFDGHGVYDKTHGLGGLVFEHPDGPRDGKLQRRPHEVVTADRLGAELRHAGVGLFFLEACQSAKSVESPEASVAGKLLESGIASVAAMSHSVLVETARRFTEVFYPALVRGERVGAAMLEGQRKLYDERQRGWAWRPLECGDSSPLLDSRSGVDRKTQSQSGDESPHSKGRKLERCPLELQDWFVPVLYQSGRSRSPTLQSRVVGSEEPSHGARGSGEPSYGDDAALLTESPPSERVRREIERDRVLALGGLPDPPDHAFVGRSRELLAAERLLIERQARYVVLRGEGGEGKTTLGAELARWLVSTRRMHRAAFASVEHVSVARPESAKGVRGSGSRSGNSATPFADSGRATPGDPRALVWAWGEQLIGPNFASRAGDSLASAETLVLRTLAERNTVLVLDNLETILPPPADTSPTRQRGDGAGNRASDPSLARRAGVDELAGARVFDQATLDEILGLCRRLLDQAPGTRIVFTSREPLPAGSGFDGAANVLEIGRMGVREGMELVARVLASGAGGALKPEAQAKVVQAKGLPAKPSCAGASGSNITLRAEALQAQREEEIKALVETVNGHARSLVLLTPELARRGLAATTEELAEIMADLERRYPGERERSLFASVELSLRRLPTELRKKLAPLGVFQGGCVVQHIAMVCDFEVTTHDDLIHLAAPFVSVGLAELIPLGVPYLRFDPALAPALRRELIAGDDADRTAEAAARCRWAEAYRQLAGFLYQQQSQDAHLAAHLTVLELPNLLAALRLYADCLVAPGLVPAESQRHPATRADATQFSDGSDRATGSPTPPKGGTPTLDATPETVIEFASALESLLQYLGRREALVQASAIRQRAHQIHTETVGGKRTKMGFEAAWQQVERLLDAGRFREAVAAAQALVQAAEAAGDDAYEGAAYDRAMAQFTLGRALKMSGSPQAALEPLATARSRFESLAKSMQHEDHRKTAARMASACLTDEADCLRHLGQLDAAAAKYEEGIARAKNLGDRRQVAAAKGQLGTVRMLQERYGDALRAHHEARDTFKSLDEPEQVATAWHQIGMVHKRAGNLEEAETAYLKSLAMMVQAGNKPGEAASRNELGNLYDRMEGRREDAVRFYREAAEIYADPATANPPDEGLARNNAADTLVALGRYAEARAELTRALECNRGLGPNAEPWTTWNILHNLETAVGNAAAAAAARLQAMAAYETARRQGWQITAGPAAQLSQAVALVVMKKSARLAHKPDAPARGDSAGPSAQIPADLRARLPQIEAGLRRQLEAAASNPRTPAYLQVLAPKLLAILGGARDLALADDPALDYDDAVELKLLLEQLPA